MDLFDFCFLFIGVAQPGKVALWVGISIRLSSRRGCLRSSHFTRRSALVKSHAWNRPQKNEPNCSGQWFGRSISGHKHLFLELGLFSLQNLAFRAKDNETSGLPQKDGSKARSA